jgi:phosphoenolpyruvate carboxylase
MALTKADITTAKEYTAMVKEEKIAVKIFGEVTAEYERTKRSVLQITGQDDLLDHVPNIKESIRLRNPYVDPLNFFQVELILKLRQMREEGISDKELLEEVLLTINGIAAGLRNTG